MNPSDKKGKPAKDDKDSRIRRRGSVPLTVMLGLAIGIFGNSYLYHSSKLKSHDAQVHRLNAAKNRAADAKQAEAIIAEYLDAYRDFKRAGIIGEEQRVNRVQAAVDEASKRKIPNMSYKLEPRESFMPDYLFQEGSYELKVSKMTLSWSLLHENDFFSVLSRLQERELGIYHVRECELRRINGTISLDPEAANISSDCELHWLLVDVSQAAGESS